MGPGDYWYRRSVEIAPTLAAARGNLGIALARARRLEEAVTECRRAVELMPLSAAAHNNLGNVLRDSARVTEAVLAYRQAIALQPDHAHAWNNLGSSLRAQGALDDAVAAVRHALHLQPTYSDAWSNLGNVLRERGELDEAMAAYRRALALRPDDGNIHGNLLMTSLYHPAFDQSAVRQGFQQWEKQHVEPLRVAITAFSNIPDPIRRLRIGYVSPDFRDHVTAQNLLPLFKEHDHAQFDIFCYADTAKSDEVTAQFRMLADSWRETTGVADEKLASMIRRDGIDVLVDLASHSPGHRLQVFARQPAPVQLSFAAYPGSTELAAIPARISDRFLEQMPPAGGHTSSPLLIDNYWCYAPACPDLAVNALPAGDSGHVSFGSLNAFCKINDAVLQLWAQILGAVRIRGFCF